MDEENSESPSDDQFELTEKKEKPKKAPGKKAPGKRPHSRGGQGNQKPIQFDSQIPAEETERKLCQLLGEHLVDAASDDMIISDQLSVRDLRVIIRVLDLMTAEQVNVRKSILLDCIQNFIRSERMKEVYSRYLEELESAGEIDHERAEELRKKHAVLEPLPPTPDFPKSEESMRVKSAPPSSPGRRRALAGLSTTELSGRRIAIPKLRADVSVPVSEQLEFIAEVNQFVIGVNRDLCEMERIASVLADRCEELAAELKV